MELVNLASPVLILGELCRDADSWGSGEHGSFVVPAVRRRAAGGDFEADATRVGRELGKARFRQVPRGV
jgi:hypothetical protein